jgi:hypothetical protein
MISIGDQSLYNDTDIDWLFLRYAHCTIFVGEHCVHEIYQAWCQNDSNQRRPRGIVERMRWGTIMMKKGLVPLIDSPGHIRSALQA